MLLNTNHFHLFYSYMCNSPDLAKGSLAQNLAELKLSWVRFLRTLLDMVSDADFLDRALLL